jgi:hypothetical protein
LTFAHPAPFSAAGWRAMAILAEANGGAQRLVGHVAQVAGDG